MIIYYLLIYLPLVVISSDICSLLCGGIFVEQRFELEDDLILPLINKMEYPLIELKINKIKYTYIYILILV